MLEEILLKLLLFTLTSNVVLATISFILSFILVIKLMKENHISADQQRCDFQLYQLVTTHFVAPYFLFLLYHNFIKCKYLFVNFILYFRFDFLKSFIYFFPVNDIFKCANIFCSICFILQKIRMFPHIQNKYWLTTP